MNIQIQQLLTSGVTLIVLIVIGILVGFCLKKLREYKVTLKGLLGDNKVANQVIDEIYTMITEIVTEITLSVSEKYTDDGIITKEEMALIKEEAIGIAIERLNSTQNKAIAAIYGDVLRWVTEQVEEEVTKIASGK